MSSSAPRDSAAFEVREALSEPGCVVCRLALRSVARLIHSIAYEQVNDVALRKQLRHARGFCNLHAYQWLREAHSVLGTALIYRDVLRAALRDLSTESARAERRRGLLGGLLAPARTVERHAHGCPACAAQVEAEGRYLEALVASVAVDTEARALLEASEGLCRRHTLAAARAGGPGAEYILDYTRHIVEAVLQDLDEVIRKEDYRFRDEPRSPAERAAPGRAVAWAAGAEGLSHG